MSTPIRVILGRRSFLKVAGTSAVAFVTACRPATHVAPTEVTGSATDIPVPPTLRAAPTETVDLRDELVPPDEIVIYRQDQLYTQSHADTPVVDIDEWSLTIDGLVDQPMTLRFDDLRNLPKVEEVRTLACIGNPVGGRLIGNVTWGGIDLGPLLTQAKIRSSAIRAKFTSADGYQTAVDLKWITQPGVRLVYEINGEPLQPEHGFPLRILMPGLYGQKMPKWITRIEFVDEDFQGYWERKGWSDVAEVMTNSQVSEPDNLERRAAGKVSVYGLAYAGLRRITGVQVRVDDGVWLPAKLLQSDSSLIWTQWTYDWEAEPGQHRLSVRAVDEDGFVQSREPLSLLGDSYPDGTNSIHSVTVRVE